MILKSLALTDFKNIASAHLDLSPKINCFLGNNGMGKSNVLDALYLLSFCKSFTGVTDTQLIRRGCAFAMASGNYSRRGLDEDLAAVIRPGRRKSFRRCGKEYKRLTDHIGAFPLVLLSPADMNLIAGEPAERRRFLDQIAGQSDLRYLEALIRYNEATDSRNRLLRAESNDNDLFVALEMQMDAAGTYICRRRAACIEALAPVFRKYYAGIAGSEEPAVDYAPSMRENAGIPGAIADKLAASRDRDRILGYTASGPHRDDIAMFLDGAPVRRIASQGQTKTYTSALRFAQYELLRHNLGINPLLLLDDIFDKLDANRVESIIATVAYNNQFGQIFITDTNRRHLDETIRGISHDSATSRLWYVENGSFSTLTI